MDINQINRVVFVYIIKMTQGDEEIDLYNITEDQYGDEIMNNLFNHWGERGYPDIITEYFGNQFIFAFGFSFNGLRVGLFGDFGDLGEPFLNPFY